MCSFKKKQKPVINSPVAPIVTTVLCIPGVWTDFEEINFKLLSSNKLQYIIAAGFIISSETERQYQIDICGRDDRMKDSFHYAGKVSGISDDCLTDIGKHTFVVYISGETGNLKEAENIARAGAALLNAGGNGIKIDSTGKAFEKDVWLDAVENFDEATLYDMFVIDSVTDDNGQVFSCGMHNLGLKDTIVSGLEFQQAVNLIRIFGFYQIVDKPTITHNETFQPDLQSPRFRISEERNQLYKADSLYANPYGIWRLTKI